MIQDLEEVYSPLHRGIVCMSEIYLINEKLCLDKMNELQLRNLRDFVVIYYDMLYKESEEDGQRDYTYIDKMSAVTCVIDDRLMRGDLI